jgi:lantibiotic modifying enzyme
MTLESQNLTFGLGANLPILDGQPLRAADYRDEIVEGFRATYRFLIDQRAAVFASGGSLASFAHRPVRFLFRQTRTYWTLLMNALHPDRLRDGADFSIELEALCRPLLDAAERPRLWPLVALERQTLERMDVPYFTASTSSTSLPAAAGQTLDACFAESSYDRVVTRLRAFDEADLERQVDLIRRSLDDADARKDGWEDVMPT